MQAASLHTGRGALLAPRAIRNPISLPQHIVLKSRPCALHALGPKLPQQQTSSSIVARPPLAGIPSLQQQPGDRVACKAASSSAGRLFDRCGIQAAALLCSEGAARCIAAFSIRMLALTHSNDPRLRAQPQGRAEKRNWSWRWGSRWCL